MERAVGGPKGSFPKVHGMALVPKGAKGRGRYAAGAVLGLAGTAPLAAGAVGLSERKRSPAEPRRQHTLLREGLSGTKDALKSRGESLVEPTPVKVRAAQAGVAVGAGYAGSGLARLALRGRAAGAKPVVAPIAAGLTAAASLPLGNRVVRRAGKGEYVATPTGVKRAKQAPQKPSAQAVVQAPHPRSFRADLAKFDRDMLNQRAAVTAAGGVPGIGPVTQALAAARYAPPGQKRKHATRQFVGGPVLGTAAGIGAAYGAARYGDRPEIAERAQAFQAGQKKVVRTLRTSVGMSPEGKGLAHYSPRAAKVVDAARASRAMKPFNTTGRAAVAGTALLGAKALVGTVGGQAAITANQRDQRRYRAEVSKGIVAVLAGAAGGGAAGAAGGARLMRPLGRRLEARALRAGKTAEQAEARRIGLQTLGATLLTGPGIVAGARGGARASRHFAKRGPAPGQSQREKHSLANKKRASAALSAAGGTLGIGGGTAFLLGRKNAALGLSTTGGFLGGANALLNTPIQRKEAQILEGPKKVTKREAVVFLAKGALEVRHPGEHKKLLGQYGDRGPLPKGLDRDTKMKTYEARYVAHGGPKSERWRTRAKAGETVQNAGLGVATLGGAAYLAAQTKRGGRMAGKLARHRRTLDNIAIGGATTGGAGTIAAGYAHRKQSSYANSPGGVAASALRRMRDYTPEP